MSVPVLAADIGFIDFYDAHELTELVIGKSGANTVTHIMGGRVGAEAEHALYLQGTNAFLARQHQVNNFEPRFERDIGVFEDRAHQDRKPISLGRAGWAFPFEWHSLQCIDTIASAVWAPDAFWPAKRNKIRFASIIGREQLIELSDSHLFGEFRGTHGSDLRN